MNLYYPSTEYYQDELYHYGVLGMKWGVKRSLRKNKANTKLRKKALAYDIKSDRLRRKSESKHAWEDLDQFNFSARRAANYRIKASKLKKKSLKVDDDLKKSRMLKKAGKLEFKATKQQMRANRISKTTGYGINAMRYAVKSDRVAIKAAKARMKIANNEAYIKRMKKRISEIPENDINKGYQFIHALDGIE